MPKTTKLLNIAQVKSLSTVVGMHAVGGAPGLCLFVSRNKETGGYYQYWVLRKQGKNPFKFVIGSYSTIGLKEARDQAISILNSKINPVEERRKDRELDRDIEQAEHEQSVRRQTVGRLYKEFFDWKEERGDWKDASNVRKREKYRFEKHLLYPLKNIEVGACTPEDIAAAFEPIWASSPSTCKKLLPLVRGFFMWATVVKKFRNSNLVNPANLEALRVLLPSEKIRRPSGHYPFLEPKQIPEFFKQLSGKTYFTEVSRMLAVAILTCSRSRNVRTMKWADLDLKRKLWIIPAEEMKIRANGQHIVPLSRQVLDLINIQAGMKRSEYVFSSRTDKPFSDIAMSQVIKRMHSEEKARGREGWIDREASKAQGREVIAVQHAISRASFETWAQGLRKDSRTIALCLHHDVDTKLNSAYDRDKSIEQKRELLQEWSDFCYSKVE